MVTVGTSKYTKIALFTNFVNKNENEDLTVYNRRCIQLTRENNLLRITIYKQNLVTYFSNCNKNIQVHLSKFYEILSTFGKSCK